MNHTVQDIYDWLGSLCEDSYPEDRIWEGDPSAAVRGVVVCWYANAGARAAALERGANLIVAHENLYHKSPNLDAGCPPDDEWRLNQEIKAFFRDNDLAFIQSHRTLDAYCVPRVFGDRLGLGEPVVREGWKGYEFTLVYEIEPTPFEALARWFMEAMGLEHIRLSAGDPNRVVRRLGMGWGGVSGSANLQYMELLRRHGAEVIIGGEVNEAAMQFYGDSGMEWIELGHYASEIPGIQKTAEDMARRFSELDVFCYTEGLKYRFL